MIKGRYVLNKKITIAVVIILVIAGAMFIPRFIMMSKFGPPGGEQGPSPVTVAKPEVRNITLYREFTGTAHAHEEVEIRARVRGYLEKINFEDGSDVKKGDVLFVIEQDSYKAVVDQIKAELQSSQAELKRAETDLERVRQAVASNAVSKQNLTTAEAEYEKAQASVLSSKARLTDAELDLQYTTIESPISGRIDESMVDVGNLVGAEGQTMLATIVKIKPIQVYFNLSERLIYEELMHLCDSGSDSKSIPFAFGLSSERGYPHEGFLDYINNRVDTDTGTITIRGEYANEKEKILPGMFVRVRIPTGTKENAVLIQERALGSDIGGKYLMIVKDDNTVERRQVETGRLVDGLRVIEKGLSPDETFVLEGLQFIYAGAKVQPHFEGENPAEPQSAEKPAAKQTEKD